MARISLKRRLLQISLPLLVLGAGVGVGSVIINSRPEVGQNDQAPVLRSVNALRVEARAMAATVEGQGTVEPRQQITLVPQVSGTITWVADAFVNGGLFRAGETLLRIDTSDHALAVTSAEAAVADALQQLETARAQAAQAEAEWAMLKRGAPTALALRKPQLAGAEAKLLAAEADLERARLQLARTEITAPFTGMLSDKQVDFGQYLGAGTEIGRLLASDILEVRLALPERELAKLDAAVLAAGSAAVPVTLSTLAGNIGSQWHGRLVRSEGVIDPLTRNLTLVAQFAGAEQIADDGAVLTIGQFVRARISGRQLEEVYSLPRTALHRATSVYIVDAEQRLREREVELLEVAADHIIVAGGLSNGDMVSISPLTSSVEGQQVQVVEAPQQTIPAAEQFAPAPVDVAAEGVTL